ncbi:MAG: hypothetical protein KKG00_16310 [Bacteroidetes bacterium]|nr:hypothetical protein [Bacteroidota bacterium]
MEQELTFRIILLNPTQGVVFGLQKGSGNRYEPLQKQKGTTGELVFDCPVMVKGDEQKDPLPRLTGPFVQGAAPTKFIYIDIGTYAGQLDSPWSRRLKIPLSGITWDFVRQIASNSNVVAGTRVEGTGRDGGPNCATVKPFAGWHWMKQVP